MSTIVPTTSRGVAVKNLKKKQNNIKHNFVKILFAMTHTERKLTIIFACHGKTYQVL